MAGAYMSLGHAVIEVPVIAFMYFGLARYFQDSLVQLALTLLGGGMIMWLGLAMFRARARIVSGARDLPGNAFTAGIITSGFNPLFLLWWATIGSMLTMKFLDFGTGGLVALIGTHWSCDLVWLSFVSGLVYKTHRFWNKTFREWLFIGCALLLIGFGFWFLISGVQAMT
jgi:threonine/homoserine/homoserine lactone efflux protein